MVAFTAKGVAAIELPDQSLRVVVLAADAGKDDGPRLEISRATAFTTQDRELGQDTYCLATQTGATVYGGVLGYHLDGSTLTLRLERRAQSALGVPDEFSIVLDADESTVEKVRSALASILNV